jgi:copper chaperone CopZ
MGEAEAVGAEPGKESEKAPGQGPVGTTLSLSGMTCGACEKVIERVVQNNGGTVEEVDANKGVLRFRSPEGSIEGIRKELAQRGFRETDASEERGNPARVVAYIRSVVAGEQHVKVENTILNYAIGSSAALLVSGSFLYGTMLEAFGSPLRAASLLLFVVAAAVLTAYSFAHMSAYRRWMSCTNGMMVGMTTGMASGYMVGAILGATNGMFVGSVGGMAIGIAIGLSLGKSSGVMGAMEGIMAGLMSGTMGAMTTVMMVNDNVIAFMYILIGVCAVTIGGLSYMMFREAGPTPREGYQGGFAVFAWMSIALSAMMLLVMIYGPKSGIVIR